MTQAILAFSPFGCATSLKYETKRLLHAGIQICGAVLAIVGSIIRIVDRETNFETAHGICGKDLSTNIISKIVFVLNDVYKNG